MSTTVKTGWLQDNNGDKFAPKTLTSQVQTSDGILLEDKIQTDLDINLATAKSYTDTQIANISSVDAYTKSEIDTKLASKSDLTHNHDSSYDTKGAAEQALSDAKSYTDELTDGLSIGFSDVIIGMFGDDIHDGGVPPTIRQIANDEATTALDSAKAYTDTVASGKANTSHTHTIANVSGLQSALDGKAASSHNHAASNITSGTLSSDRLPTIPIAKGGTEATTAAEALANLGGVATADFRTLLETELEDAPNIKMGVDSTIVINNEDQTQFTSISTSGVIVRSDNSFVSINGGMVDFICDDGVIDGLRNPTSSSQAANKGYVDTYVDTKVPTTRTVNGKPLSADITLSASDVGAATKNVWYGTCSTTANTAAKVVTTSTGDFSLTTGNVVYVLFTYAAYSGSTLNVDGTGAKTIKVSGTANVSTYQWGANEVVAFVYDGTYFRMLDGMIATTTYYGMTKLSSSTSSTSTAMAATPSAVKSAYDLANAAMPKAGGAFTGAVTAADDTDYTTYKVRNAAIVSSTPTSMTNGTVAFVYS